MRFRPANISLINRRHYLPRLLLTLSSFEKNDQRTLTGHYISSTVGRQSNPNHSLGDKLIACWTRRAFLVAVQPKPKRIGLAVLYGCGTLPRRPHRKISVDMTITIPTLISPAVTKLSCHGRALKPGAVMGDNAPVPKIAASVVKSQFA